MMKALDRFIARYAFAHVAQSTQRLFVRLVYGYLLLNGLWLLPVHGLLWGKESLFMAYNQGDGLVINLVTLFDHWRKGSVVAYFAYLGAVGYCAFALPGERLVRPFVFALGVMLYYAAVPAWNGSTILFNLFTAYLVFMNPNAKRPAGVLFSNFALLAVRVQLVMVYALAGGYKLTGSTWIEGSSLYYGLSLERYNGLGLNNLLGEHWVLLQVLSYTALAYQLAFPVLIWFKPFRMPLMIAAVGFHAFTAIGMQLPDFGAAMIVAYFIFLPDEKAQRSVRWVLRLGRNQKSSVMIRSTE